MSRWMAVSDEYYRSKAELDLDWLQWRRIIGGFAVVIAFIVLVALAGSAS